MRILVIEDNPKHLKDAKDFFAEKKDVEVIYRMSLSDEDKNDGWGSVSHMLGVTRYLISGVISDIYFPYYISAKIKGDSFRKGRVIEAQWREEYPLGLVVHKLCGDEIPCVLNTAGYHHGPKLQWIQDMGIDMVDAGDQYFVDSDKKDWARAFEELERAIEVAKHKNPIAE